MAPLGNCDCCQREAKADSDFCGLHQMAYENLLRGFMMWRLAIPSIRAAEFLSKALVTEGLGKWAAEVAKLLLVDVSLAERFTADAERA
jgi:hypothetical protein